jgi:EAL domain-containing protein (putative c-di-GMP-specific phosphodiesterase class I)/CheY-like chemotaxis protein
MSEKPRDIAMVDASADAPGLVPDLPEAKAAARAVCVVIDDEPGIQNIISGAGSPLGFRVLSFRTAEKALKAIQGVKPSLVFLDITLEGSDAVDVIRGLDGLGFTGAVQLMSGRDAQTMEEVRRVGDRHSLRMLPPLRKPFRLDDIRAILRQHLTAPIEKREQAKDALSNEPSGRIDLEAALRKNWLELWYQPKIDLKEMRICGAEGLARCRHPERGIVAPGAFLPGASDSQMMRLTEMVLRIALGDWVRFAQIGFPFRLAVNVPVSVLVKLPILSIVRDHRPKNDNWPGIILEVTEDQVVQDIPLVHEIATQLRIHNIRLAIDDFGTGYSHLARLQELPFVELKLAHSLVMNCGRDAANASVCRAAIELAHRFGVAATAEGIENIAEVKALREMHCDLGQGFLFGKPMPRDKLLSSLVDHAAARSGAASR